MTPIRTEGASVLQKVDRTMSAVMALYSTFFLVLLAGTGPPVESKILSGRRYESPFSVEELLNLVIPKKQSQDIDMDPCKSPAFIGDIAYPEGNKTKKGKKGFRDNFDVRDTISEPRVGRGLSLDDSIGKGFLKRKNYKHNTHENSVDKLDTSSVNRVKWPRKVKKHKSKSIHQKVATQAKISTTKYSDYSGPKVRMHPDDEKILQRVGTFNSSIRNHILMPEETTEHLIRHRRSRRRKLFRSHKSKMKLYRHDGFEPDIDDQDRTRVKRAATARPERIWDYAVIPYEIDSNFSGVHKALFKQAMRHWENYTCIQFVERTSEHPNWIVFTERPCGCCSFVGKRGNGPQAISIGKNCDKFGIVVHELGHVVGFWHEHTRPDRDNWVEIKRENVMIGQEYNFNKLTSEEVNSLGLRYDYDSIMHYARNTFSKGTYLDTILPKSDLPENQAAMPEIGQRIRLSKGDILQTTALYECPACGKTYQETSAKFASPQYNLYTPPSGVEPVHFKKGDQCQWRILATHGEKIILNITSLDIPASVNCQLDYLEVRDGYWYKSDLLAKLCGNKIPAAIISTGSRMLLTYKTHNLSPDHKGFTAQYEAVCGGDLDMETGQLESPNFPEDYQPNKECIWRIKVPEDFQVALKFQSFEIENHDNCVYDFLEIRDGENSSADLIGTFCGYKMPKDIKSTSNSLWIKFVSDGSVQKAGFSASFMKEYDECHSPDHGCEHECINTLGGYSCSCRIGYELHSDDKRCENACGGIIDTANGTITSPSFPDIYPSNKNCIWEIIAPPQWRITINFTHFDIEGNNQDCEYDSLTISSKMGSEEARNHGLFCGNKLPPVITSEGNSLRLEFLSDNSVQKNGFAAIFFTDKDECATDNGGCQHVCRNTIGAYYCSCHQGFVLHENGHDCKEGGCKHEIKAAKGEISSPHYPDYYPAKKECVWIFSTTPGHRIKLLFTEFELEPHQECAYDHIVVYDGHTTDEQILGRFCGSKLPHPLIATDSTMLLVFKSDASVQRKGFMAEHMTVCGGHLTALESSSQIFSHAKFGDVNYDNKEDCDWIIEATQGKNVHLSFLTFELEDEQDCGYDFIEVFSGYDDSGPSYGRFCGNKIPPEIISVDEALLLRFKSDDTINSKGFSANFVIIDESDNKDYEYFDKPKVIRGY